MRSWSSSSSHHSSPPKQRINTLLVNPFAKKSKLCRSSIGTYSGFKTASDPSLDLLEPSPIEEQIQEFYGTPGEVARVVLEETELPERNQSREDITHLAAALTCLDFITFSRRSPRQPKLAADQDPKTPTPAVPTKVIKPAVVEDRHG